MKTFLFLILINITLISYPQSYGTMKGKISDYATNQIIDSADVFVKLGDTIVAKTTADINGEYVFKALKPAEYNLYCLKKGYYEAHVNGIVINSGRITFVDIGLKPDGYKEPKVKKNKKKRKNNK